MKVLILNGSPRKGNTKCALGILEKAIQEKHGNAICEIIDVPALKIQGCVNCDGCKKNDGNCVHKDGSADFINKVMDADVLIFGSPVYWWGITSQLKAAIDKFYSRIGFDISDKPKKVGVISIGELELTDIQYKLIEEQFKNICNNVKWDMIFNASYSYYKKDELKNDKEVFSKIVQLAEKL